MSDLVLQAVGRTPNGKKVAAEKAGVAVSERGFINVDIQMRTNVPHKAVHEAHVAAEAPIPFVSLAFWWWIG